MNETQAVRVSKAIEITVKFMQQAQAMQEISLSLSYTDSPQNYAQAFQEADLMMQRKWNKQDLLLRELVNKSRPSYRYLQTVGEHHRAIRKVIRNLKDVRTQALALSAEPGFEYLTDLFLDADQMINVLEQAKRLL